VDTRLLEYYNRELRYLRELGGEFARDFPKIAGRLGLDAFECADPYVERLLEGFAFLAARVQLKVDAEVPSFSEQLLNLVCPHYLGPTPSMAVVEVTPDQRQGTLNEGFVLPRGTALRAGVPRSDAWCEYRTAHEVTLWPIEIASLTIGPATGSAEVTFASRRPVKSLLRIRLRTTNGAGQVNKAEILFSIFPANSTGGAVVVCPQQGTAGLTKVEIAGGYFKANASLVALADDSALASTKTDTKGSWSLNVTSDLQPMVNGTLYTITTSPRSLTRTFLTLEGIAASPHSGEPGTSFRLEGRSYPANTAVSIYLGGVYLGRAQTDGNGTFSTGLQIPSSFRYAGVYQFTTSPPVLGATATFTIPVSTTTPVQPAPSNWWYLLIPIVAALLILGLYLWRRKPLVELEVYQEAVTTPFKSTWAIRVWSSRRLDRCGVIYGNMPLRSLISPTESRLEMTLHKGRYLDFRIPDTLPVDQEALVVVRAKGKNLASERFGSIPRTNPKSG